MIHRHNKTMVAGAASQHHRMASSKTPTALQVGERTDQDLTIAPSATTTIIGATKVQKRRKVIRTGTAGATVAEEAGEMRIRRAKAVRTAGTVFLSARHLVAAELVRSRESLYHPILKSWSSPTGGRGTSLTRTAILLARPLVRQRQPRLAKSTPILLKSYRRFQKARLSMLVTASRVAKALTTLICAADRSTSILTTRRTPSSASSIAARTS